LRRLLVEWYGLPMTTKKRKTAMPGLIKAQHAADPSVLRKAHAATLNSTLRLREEVEAHLGHARAFGAKAVKLQKTEHALRNKGGAHGQVHAAQQAYERAATTAYAHSVKARQLRKQLPQGYAMVFGRLRKINPKGARTGIAKLKR